MVRRRPHPTNLAAGTGCLPAGALEGVGADSRDPDVVFRQATIASGTKNSSLVTLEGTVAQRARNRELAIEADFVRDLAESAEDDGPEAAVDTAEDAAIDVEAD